VHGSRPLHWGPKKSAGHKLGDKKINVPPTARNGLAGKSGQHEQGTKLPKERMRDAGNLHNCASGNCRGIAR